MKCGTRAFVALVTGEIFGRRPLDSIYDRDEKINMTKGTSAAVRFFRLKKYVAAEFPETVTERITA